MLFSSWLDFGQTSLPRTTSCHAEQPQPEEAAGIFLKVLTLMLEAAWGSNTLAHSSFISRLRPTLDFSTVTHHSPIIPWRKMHRILLLFFEGNLEPRTLANLDSLFNWKNSWHKSHYPCRKKNSYAQFQKSAIKYGTTHAFLRKSSSHCLKITYLVSFCNFFIYLFKHELFLVIFK